MNDATVIELCGTDVTVGLLVRLEAKPGKEADVAEFLRDALSAVEAEPGTTG
jgi:quinol monooxygenase YgiN